MRQNLKLRNHIQEPLSVHWFVNKTITHIVRNIARGNKTSPNSSDNFSPPEFRIPAIQDFCTAVFRILENPTEAQVYRKHSDLTELLDQCIGTRICQTRLQKVWGCKGSLPGVLGPGMIPILVKNIRATKGVTYMMGTRGCSEHGREGSSSWSSSRDRSTSE